MQVSAPQSDIKWPLAGAEKASAILQNKLKSLMLFRALPAPVFRPDIGLSTWSYAQV
jgi:hypothetical protein